MIQQINREIHLAPRPQGWPTLDNFRLVETPLPEPGPNNLMLMVGRRLSMRGFIVSDHGDRPAAFRQEVGGYLREGRLVVRETIIDGIEHAPEALLALLRGDHLGKLSLRLAPDQDGA